MAEQLLNNTCFHEINVAGIPENTDITRIVSLNGTVATMHTRQDGAGAPASTDNFEPEILDRARLFLITSYNDKKVVDATILTQAKKVERENIKLEDAAGDGNQEHAVRAAADKVYEARKLKVDEAARSAGMTDVDLAEAKKFLDTNDLFTLLIDEGKSKEDILDAAKAAEMAAEMDGGKRTRRRKNHGSKRRNASNKSGRRASKQSRRRGKKQSKRHGRK